MALVWAFSGDLTGSKVPLVTNLWTFYERQVGFCVADIFATGRHPISGYGGSDYAFRLDPSPWGAGSSASVDTPIGVFAALTDGIFAFHEWRDGHDDSAGGLGGAFIKSGTTLVVRLKVSSVGIVSVYVHDGSSLALQFTCTSTWPSGTTRYFAIRYKPGASGEIGVALDGGAADTASGSFHTGAWDGLRWDAANGYGGNRYIWMPTVWDSASDPALGAVQWVAKIAANADAVAGGWTPSAGGDLFAMIDEAVYSASDYGTTTTTPNDEYRCTGSWVASIDAAWAPAAINGVVGYAAVRGDSLLSASEIAWSSGGTAAHGTTTATSSTSVVLITDTLAVNPNGSAAWTTTMLNTLQFGVKVS